MHIERKSRLTCEKFQNDYLTENRPLIITGGMLNWEAKKYWTPHYLNDHFGSEEIQIYDDLFNLINVTSLGEYLEKYFIQNHTSSFDVVPYARWYTRSKDYEFAWADNFFNKIRTQWEVPYFLPKSNYLLPYCPSSKLINPTEENFPAKGIFISPKGAMTKLHYDPWCSDAILCQVYGEKHVIMYPPDQKDYLCNEVGCVNINKPDLQLFPNFLKATPAFIDTLKPGEIIFFPHGWFHQVETISNSISLTWNFVHISTWRAFFKYITTERLSEDELQVFQFFLKNSDFLKI